MHFSEYHFHLLLPKHLTRNFDVNAIAVMARGDAHALHALHWESCKMTRVPPLPITTLPWLEALLAVLQEWLEGGEPDVASVPLYWGDTTDFQRQVLLALLRVKRGEVCHYQDVARMIHRPRAARATGSALARNPFAIILPCHRVIHSDGTLGGYEGGKDEPLLEKKALLLALEGVTF